MAVILPPNVPRPIILPSKIKIWIYGAAYTGKTRFANEFPNALMLNTDGNTGSCTCPFIDMRREVIPQGRATPKVTEPWTKFKEVIDELEKSPDCGYETIVVDLLDDLYESCRVVRCKELHINHESDDPYKAWDKVRGEFFEQVQRLTALPFNFVFISHEEFSKDLSGISGEKQPRIKPSMHDAVCDWVTSRVDITARASSDARGKTLLLDPVSDTTVGGARLKCKTRTIPMTYLAVKELYEYNGLVIAGQKIEPAGNETTETEIKEN